MGDPEVEGKGRGERERREKIGRRESREEGGGIGSGDTGRREGRKGKRGRGQLKTICVVSLKCVNSLDKTK